MCLLSYGYPLREGPGIIIYFSFENFGNQQVSGLYQKVHYFHHFVTLVLGPKGQNGGRDHKYKPQT